MSEEEPALKEGYLVKKGHVRHNWRTRWFVLRKATLSYYKKREDTGPAGVIPLVAAVLQCPAQHISKRPWLMYLTTSDGKEYLIQAPDQRTRDEWKEMVQECIRMLDPSKLGRDVTLTRVNGRTSDEERNIVQAMQDKEAGVTLVEYEGKSKSKMTKPCVRGCDVIQWLISWSFASTREEAIAVATTLLGHGYFYPLSSGGDTPLTIDTESHSMFCDSETSAYAFVSFSPLEEVQIYSPQQDSGGSEESDSEEEDFVYIRQQEAMDLSNMKVLKQGFLMKKMRSRMRNKWKPRKFVLYADCLVYHKGSKDEVKAAIPIKDTTVTDMDDEDTPPGEDNQRHSRKMQLRDRFVLITAQGVRYRLQATSPEEKKEWLSLLREACHRLSSTPAPEIQNV